MVKCTFLHLQVGRAEGERRKQHTELCQQLVDGLDDVGLERSEVLLEVFLAESSRGQQLVQGLLLVGFLAAASRAATKRASRHSARRDYWMWGDD